MERSRFSIAAVTRRTSLKDTCCGSEGGPLKNQLYQNPFYPAYAKKIGKPSPNNNLLWLIVGDNWDLAKEKQNLGFPVILIQINMPLENMKLPVKGFEVLIVDCGIPATQYAKYLLFKLVNAGAIFIYIISLKNEAIDGLQWDSANGK